jgi:hypothetical protein
LMRTHVRGKLGPDYPVVGASFLCTDQMTRGRRTLRAPVMRS